ncbi:unnamed protein product [Lota lota]
MGTAMLGRGVQELDGERRDLTQAHVVGHHETWTAGDNERKELLSGSKLQKKGKCGNILKQKKGRTCAHVKKALSQESEHIGRRKESNITDAG